jgi:hypothetical protein
MPNKPKIVCLCGSTRFIEQFAILQWTLEKEGYITLGLHLLPASYPGVTPDHMAETEGIKEQMDELHKRKIDLADEILVLNIGGYIGESTRSEIEYAKAHGKPVKYLEPTTDKEKVLAVHPKADSVNYDIRGWMIWSDFTENRKMLGSDITEELAWHDAAANLPEKKP